RSRTIALFFLAQFQTCWRTSGWDTSQSTASERMMSNGSPVRKWRKGGIRADAWSAGGNLRRVGGVVVAKFSGISSSQDVCRARLRKQNRKPARRGTARVVLKPEDTRVLVLLHAEIHS